MEFHNNNPSLPPHPTLIAIGPGPSSPPNHDHHRCFPVMIRSISSILTRFHAGYFRITLSLGSQALLWKNLIEPTSHNTINPLIQHLFHRFHPITFVSFWAFSLVVLVLLSLVYLFRCIFHFNMVKAEFLHHVGVNYLFAPWISWLLLLQCSPWVDQKTGVYLSLWWTLVVPVVALDLKIYGQWFTTKGTKYNLTAVANPTSQMSVIGNLVGSTAAARMGWSETAMILFSLGMVHYLVLFVTLYQRLSGSDKLPAMLRPVFFLFFAAPGVASLAWGSISGKFDTTAKMLFFLSVFLFMSLQNWEDGTVLLRLPAKVVVIRMQAITIQESDEEVQRDMVGIFVPNHGVSNSCHRIRRGSKGKNSRCINADSSINVNVGHFQFGHTHTIQLQNAFA